MKKRIFYFVILAIALLVYSCQVDYITPDKGALPQAGSLKPVITVDQETNYVTFSIQDKGVVPIWIFGEEKIDGKASKKYAYTDNGVTLRIRDAGTHTVELKAYNANGISQGSQMVTFELENTYRDPFDPAPYMKAMANTWAWDKENPGHFGCGESFENATGWWSCGANEKADSGLYDDLMTFTADGQYTFNPGVGGTVYVNYGSGYKPEGHEDEIASSLDYQAPIDEYTHPYTIENNWNDAGIEEIYLVLQQGDNLSYIPNAEAISTLPRYRFVNTLPADIKKNLKLVHTLPGISWMFSFVPYVKGVTVEELLAGTDPAGKVWVMDAEARGHLGCGPSLEDPVSWWGAGPFEKDGFGVYDNELTFTPDGNYIFNPGPDGEIYVNKDVTYLGGPAGEDFVAPFDAQTVKYHFDGEVITFPSETTIGYIPNNDSYLNPVFYVTNITEASMTLVSVIEGIAWQFIFRARDYVAPESSFGGVPFEGNKANVSLENGKEYVVTGVDLSTMWTDPDNFEYVSDNTLRYIGVSGDFQVMNKTTWLKVLPLSGSEYATYDDGKALWIIGEGISKPKGDAAPGWTTDAAVDIPFTKTGTNTYQLTAYVTGPNFKIFGQPNWGKEFTGTDFGTVNLNGYFSINGYPAGTDTDSGNIWSGDSFVEGWYVFKVTDNDGVLDMEVDRWRVETTIFDIAGSGNLWKSATITPEYWYSPADWSGGIDAEVEILENNGIEAKIPAGVGGSEWQAQNKFHSGIATSSEKKYDFCCTIVASEDMTITLKLTGNPEGDGDPHAFFYDGSVNLVAGETFTYKKSNISQAESNNDMTVIFDFGRSPVGSTIKVTDICFQEHNGQSVLVE